MTIELGWFQNCLRQWLEDVKMSVIVDFIALLADIAREHGLLVPLYIDQAHPIPDRIISKYFFNNMDSVGSGANSFQAQNNAACQMWLQLGHLITIDPTLVIYLLFLLCFLIFTTIYDAPQDNSD
jgi:hypothetical protein